MKTTEDKKQSFRYWLYHVLEDRSRELLPRSINIALIVLIFANVIAIVASSEEIIDKKFNGFFEIFEVFSLVVFTIEYVLRVWVSVENKKKNRSHPVWGRIRYMFTPMAVVDFLAIAPSFFMFLGVDFLILRALRLVRIFKLTRYSRSMGLLITVLKQEADTVISAIFILLILIVISATGMFLVEGDVQPEEFGSIPRALWWATVTLTTVGYGDVVPITPLGRMLGIVIVITGIGMAALPAGIMASGFTSEINRRRERFKAKVMDRIIDGKLLQKDRLWLDNLRNELGISRADAGLMISEVRSESKISSHIDCPHCGKPVHVRHKSGHVSLDKKKTNT